MPALDDLAALPRDVAESAPGDAVGEVWWHSQDAGHVILARVEPVTEEDF